MYIILRIHVLGVDILYIIFHKKEKGDLKFNTIKIEIIV